MILKASQRGGARALAAHLLRTDENDHVEVAELRGFLAEDLEAALIEIHAISKGTRCTQPLYSVSLNPPKRAHPDRSVFESALAQIEQTHGLTDQPRALVFHEKDGRRHMHAVWSRIDAQTMTAVNLPHFKNKLQTISRELFIEHGWTLPEGLMLSERRNPTNVTLAEWQAAKRRGRNAIDQKEVIRECWASSDDAASFATALKDRGYLLANGDRRSPVVATHDGQVIAVARATGQRVKAVRERLADRELPSVSQAMETHKKDLTSSFTRIGSQVRSGHKKAQAALERRRSNMIARHRAARSLLSEQQAERHAKETALRKTRLKSGLPGIWQWITGARKRVHALNAAEVTKAKQRDHGELKAMSETQLNERHELETQRTRLRKAILGLIRDIRADRTVAIEKLSEAMSKSTLRQEHRRLRDARRHLKQDPTFEP